MVGIAAALAPMVSDSATRLAHALAATDIAPIDLAARHASLLAKRDALLALVA